MDRLRQCRRYIYIVLFFNFISGATSHQAIKNSYDFIVVGAGSAGSVIANRLSEIGGWTVLLIEAGGDETLMGQVPVNAPALQLTEVDW